MAITSVLCEISMQIEFGFKIGFVLLGNSFVTLRYTSKKGALPWQQFWTKIAINAYKWSTNRPCWPFPSFNLYPVPSLSTFFLTMHIFARWLYCVEYPQYSIRLETLAYLYVSSNTMSPALRSILVPSGILIHPAIWPQQTPAENSGGCCAPYEKLGSYLTQCGLGRGLPPYQMASWSIQPFGQNKRGPKKWGLLFHGYLS